MLCHLESIEYEGTSTPVSVECSDPVTTDYTITFSSGASNLITLDQIVQYLGGMLADAQASTGYSIEYVANSGSITGDAFTCQFVEPTTGIVGKYACQLLQSGGFSLGDEACYITGVAAGDEAYCEDLEVCPLGDGNTTVYTLAFWQPVTQIAIKSEVASLVSMAQQLVPFSLIGMAFEDDMTKVNLTIFEYDVGSFSTVFGMAIQMGQV